MTIAAVLGISNYFRGVHFFNPIYAVSAERLVDYIEQHSMPGDIVLSTEDIGFNYYANERSIETPRYLSYTPEADHAIEHAAAARIWWLTFGRDSTSALVNPATYRDQLARAGYVLESQQGFVPQDPTYQRVKEQLLNRDAYTHKVTISLYVPR
ncbi:MAG: hypothetical protein GX620_05395 [Chloroflexi bacterium]|nr:hypothetical protein [Chloroflexota bacterium]